MRQWKEASLGALIVVVAILDVAETQLEWWSRARREVAPTGRAQAQRGHNRNQYSNRKLPSTKKPPSILDADAFLEKYGYLEQTPDDVQHSIQSRRAAIRGFQRMTGLRVTGKIDKATRTKMAAPRCGNPDVTPRGSDRQWEPIRNGHRKPMKYYAPGYKWKTTDLTYAVLNSSPDMDPGLQRLAFDNAFKYWSSVSPLHFTEVASANANIKIKFGYGEHGDAAGNAFDGPGGVLAHAFFPEDGSTHFDESETWDWAGTKGTVHLQTVAAHEFGHALGLAHSAEPGALMAPYYQGFNPNFKLTQDDIDAIHSLYGRREVRPTSRPTTGQPQPTTPARPTGRPSGKPDSCTAKFGAVLQAHDAKIYVFTGKWLWRLNNWAVDDGYPSLARKSYQRAPPNIGAAVYSWRTRHTYFFKGKKIFKYYGFELVQRKTVRQAGYPSKPDAAFMSGNGRIYIFQGSRFWELDEYEMEMSGTSLPISSKWPGLPANVESAVRLRDGYLYFFKGSRYRKYDEASQQVVHGYPKDKAGPFMGILCGGRYIPK